jgi:hypothetical protein
MKYILLLFIATFMVFSSCKKKKTDTHCYTCMKYDSLHSNIPAECSKEGYFENASDTMCNYTEETIDYYMHTHVSRVFINIMYTKLIVL